MEMAHVDDYSEVLNIPHISLSLSLSQNLGIRLIFNLKLPNG